MKYIAGLNQSCLLLFQLSAFLAMTVIAYLVILLTGEVFIITLGPFNPWYCHTQVLLKHWTTAILVLMADCIVIVRSVLIFWLKSPSIVHDDFWNCFLTTWIIGFAGASQFVSFFFQERRPLNYYICIGDFPENERHFSYKTKWSLIAIILLSIIVVTFLTAAIELYKKKISNSEISIVKLNLIKDMEKNLYVNGMLIISAVMLLVSASLLLIEISRMSPQQVITFPNYYLFWLLNTLPPVIVSSFGCSLFISKTTMRQVLIREFREWMRRINCCKRMIEVLH